MSDWPIIPLPGDHNNDDVPPVVGRVANILIPVTLLDTGRTIKILTTMPEADARALVNMNGDQARSMGPFFEAIKEHLTEFIRQEG